MWTSAYTIASEGEKKCMCVCVHAYFHIHQVMLNLGKGQSGRGLYKALFVGKLVNLTNLY